ncbi:MULTISPECIES: CsgE family curli-type amyloid fiber assembly protein [unclassified Flavobacterium]|uniref:CsgE family curli-type amyloid fiber assembly protein n=2 Tax=Flavobacterium TaxID=237 RepID=UPI00068DF4B3|nr:MULTISPECIES: CsgE family curli-type amyloid fiber assembly protein [unclassified Flavobacterium]MEA9411945.1 CsgE family curli-type amyloid fiber assembly protein [Flavobacterium sp. PL02]
MERYNLNIILIIMMLVVQNTFAQVVYTEVKAKIEIEQIENSLAITGTAENLKAEFKNISYKLSVLKVNKSNTNKSNNAQDGRVTLEPIQKVNLSKTQVNFTKDDEIIILLLIYDDNNAVIGKDKVIFGGKDESKTEIQTPTDGLEMIGIVSNDTKTKLGNDFYDYFYSEYSKLKIKSHKIVTVREELTFGRTTKIMIDVDGEIIDEFISRPDEDFLKYMAESSSAKIFKYFKNIERQNKLITQY